MSAYQAKLLRSISIAYRLRDAYRRRRPDLRRAAQHRSEFYFEIWREAAAHMGATVQPLGGEILDIRRGQTRTLVRQNITGLDDPVTIALAFDKPTVHRLLAERGLRVPRHLRFRLEDVTKAMEFMEGLGCACVVKPAASGGGWGVTTGITSRFALLRAAVWASAYDPHLLIEEQIEGDVYRLLYLDGKLLDVVAKKSPTVIADGRSTVRELAKRENQARLQAGASTAYLLIPFDLDMRSTLARQGLSLSSVPPAGTVVKLKTVNNESSRTDNIAMKDLVCQSIIEDGRAAAAACGVRLAGIDLAIPDPSKPLAESGGVILEVNATPAYHQHYCRQGTPCPVALPILTSLLGEKPATAIACEPQVSSRPTLIA